MSKHAMWVPGYSALAEDGDLTTIRRGWGIEYRFPDQTGRRSWFHLPIPTPVIVQDRRTNLTAAWVLFATVTRTEIREIRVFDGPHEVHRDPLPRHGDHSKDYDNMNRINVRRSGIRFGVGLSVMVTILPTPTGAPVQPPAIYFSTAGADFDV